MWARLGRMAPLASPLWPRSLLERSRQQASLKWVRMENRVLLWVRHPRGLFRYREVFLYICVLSSGCGIELFRLELNAVLQPCLFFPGPHAQPTSGTRAGHAVPDGCFWRLLPQPGWGGGSHVSPAEPVFQVCRVLTRSAGGFRCSAPSPIPVLCPSRCLQFLTPTVLCFCSS